MDGIDRIIIKELQRNGKLSMTELGKKIGLSASATGERVRKLEQEEIIRGYTVLVDAAKVGKDITAFILVPVGSISIDVMARQIVEIPQVQECHKVTGNTCFIVKVKTKNTKELENLIDKINNVAPNTYTYLALSTLKETTWIEI